MQQLLDSQSILKLRKFMVARPQLARIIGEFEQNLFSTEKKHREQYKQLEKKFKEDTSSLIGAFTELGNPFMEDSCDLVLLETYQIMDKSVVRTVTTITETGSKKYAAFVSERIQNP